MLRDNTPLQDREGRTNGDRTHSSHTFDIKPHPQHAHVLLHGFFATWHCKPLSLVHTVPLSSPFTRLLNTYINRHILQKLLPKLACSAALFVSRAARTLSLCFALPCPALPASHAGCCCRLPGVVMRPAPLSVNTHRCTPLQFCLSLELRSLGL